MIHELIAYAQRKGLGTPGIVARTVKYAINLSAEGTYLGVDVLGDASVKKNPGLEFDFCPDTPGMNSGGKAHFLADSLDKVTGLGDEEGKKVDCRAFFIDLLRKASEVMPEASLFADCLDRDDTRQQILNDLTEMKAKPSDKITLMVEDRTPAFLLEDEAWRDWWSDLLSSLTGGSKFASEPESEEAEEKKKKKKKKKRKKKATGMRCFGTGAWVEPSATHPKITTLADVGGSPTGALLVSFDKDALCSYGLKKSANAAMSEEAAAMYAAAFNHIAAKHSHRLAGAKVLCWFSADLPPEGDPNDWAYSGMISEQDERQALAAARTLYQSIQKGKYPELAENRYHALIVSGNAGRVMVRDWMEGSYAELAGHVLEWFDDLSIIARDGKALARPPKFLAVVGCLFRELKDAPAPLIASLWRAATMGRSGQIPATALARAVERVRVDIVKDNPANHARMGLLKAYHIREGDPNMTTGLNKDYPHPAYHCGRVMAVLADLQYAALGDVGAGVVQRYYAAASATPAMVLGRLIRNSRFHIDKLGRDKKGLAHYFDEQLAEIHGKLDPANLPTTLTLSEQSLFALGYYHQKSYRIAKDKSKDADAAETEGDAQE